MEILFAYLMECADNATLKHGPKTINGAGMNCATNIFPGSMVNDAMIEKAIKVAIARVIISRDQADLIRYRCMNEIIKGLGIDVIHHAGHHLTATACGPDYGSFAGRSTAPTTLIPMLILGFTAHKGFIDLDKTQELAKFFIAEANPDAVTHRPSGPIRSHSHHPIDLQSTYPLLATQHKIDDLKPSLQRIICVLENSSHQDGEAISPLSRTAALPVVGAAKLIDLIAAAPGAPDAFRPAPGNQIGFAGIFVWEHGLKFGKSQGFNGLGFHRESPSILDDYQDNT